MHNKTVVFGIILIITILMGSGCEQQKEETKQKKEVQQEQPSKIQQPKQASRIQQPNKIFGELNEYDSVLGDVVFVKKGFFGWNFYNNAVVGGDIYFKGKVRNISDMPHKNVYIILTIWSDENNLLFSQGYKIDYLDSKAEEEFVIPIEIYSGMDAGLGIKIFKEMKKEHFEPGIYVRSNSKKQ